MQRIRFRPRYFSGLIIYFLAAAFCFFVGLTGARLIARSLDTNDKWYAVLNNNLATGVISTLIFLLIGQAWSGRKGITFYGPVIGDDRRVMDRERLESSFTTDAACEKTKELGWSMSGKGTKERSVINYKSNVQPFSTITAQFCPKPTCPEGKYWRCGFLVSRADGREALCVHIDSHNTLLGYIDKKPYLRVTVPQVLEGRYSTICLQISESELKDAVKIYCQINGTAYYLGNVTTESWPWKLSIEAWSDTSKYHHVLVRDISIEERLA